MTRRREMMLEDLFECDHEPETPIAGDDGEIVEWICRCGRTVPAPAPATILKMQPRPGDVCVGCVHEPDPRDCLYYFMPAPLRAWRPDGTELLARWLLLCSACADEHGPTGAGVLAALRARAVKLGCDMKWPADPHDAVN